MPRPKYFPIPVYEILTSRVAEVVLPAENYCNCLRENSLEALQLLSPDSHMMANLSRLVWMLLTSLSLLYGRSYDREDSRTLI